MKHLLAAIAFLALLGGFSGEVQAERSQVREEERVARSTTYRAVCSKGDLNSTYSSRSAAVKAAQKHQKATGHKTSVRKQ